MSRIWFLFVLLGALLAQDAGAREESAGKVLGADLKKAGDAAGGLLEKGGKAVAPEASKADSWLERMLFKGGKKTDKANK